MKKVFVVTAAIVLLSMGLAAQAVMIDTVPVGNAGNAPDNREMNDGTSGYGSVAYNYSIGKYEVTAGQYTAFLNAVAATDTYALYNMAMSDTSNGSGIARSGDSGSYAYSVATNFINRPVNWVSWGDSARFANWLHNGQPTGLQVASTTEDGAYFLNGATTDAQLLAVNREADWRWAITSENEWHKAAYFKRGGSNPKYWLYPTQSDTIPGRDMADASGNNVNYAGIPAPIDSGKYTTVGGEFQNSDSPYGTFDQGGNVWEWNESIINGVVRGARGGSWGTGEPSLSATMRGYHPHPTIEDNKMGFRVSAVPEPSSLIALAGGLVGLLGMRRRRA